MTGAARFASLGIGLLPYLGVAGIDTWMHERARKVPRIEQLLHVVLAGLDPLLVAMLQVLNIHYQAWVHTEMIGPLGVIDRIFNTPANHRMHHSAALRRAGANFAGILSIWDRMFDTYVPPDPVLAYGTAGVPSPRSILDMYTAPFRALK